MKYLLSAVILLIGSCDFTNPRDNSLMDLNQPAVISEIAAMNVSVMDSNVVFQNGAWVVADLTNSSGWTSNRGEFVIQVKDRLDGRPVRYHFIFEVAIRAGY